MLSLPGSWEFRSHALAFDLKYWNANQEETDDNGSLDSKDLKGALLQRPFNLEIRHCTNVQISKGPVSRTHITYLQIHRVHGTG